MRWIVNEQLAASHRPGYDNGKSNSVSAQEVEEWCQLALERGIRSIICLLGEEQLDLYADLTGGLIGFYLANGFEVGQVRVDDYRSPPMDQRQLDAAWIEFNRLSKPVLIHCSAGIDRTGAAVKYIQQKLK